MVPMVNTIQSNGIRTIKITVAGVKVIFIERGVDTSQNWVKVLGDNFVLDTIDHVGIQVLNIRKALTWYTKNFKCKVLYEDATWALLEFENTKLALVTPGEHPPHFAIIDDNLKDGDTHRDGSMSVYVHDEQGNMVEKITYRDVNENKSKWWSKVQSKLTW